MTMTTLKLAGVSAVALLLAASFAAAQAPDTVRVRATIESVDGQMVTAKSRDGAELKIHLADNAPVNEVVKESLSDIKPNSYIAVTAMPQPDGSQKAVELRIFPKPQADGGHFSTDWYGAPRGTMTNGFVTPAQVATIGGAGDPTIVVKYPQGEQRIAITASTHLVRNAVGGKDDLKAGAEFGAQAATKQPDGTYTANAIAVGRDGAAPF
jgi:hypothetical protein